VSALLLILVAAPTLAAIACASSSPSNQRTTARLSILASAVSFALAAALAVYVGINGSVSAVAGGTNGAIAGLYANRITAVLLLLVCGVSTVVQVFAAGYLQGDVRARRFFAATSMLTAATAAMVSAATLVGLGLAWTLAGVALCLLLGMYADLPAARQGVRRTAAAFAIGDGALWLAIAIALANWGDLDLRHLQQQAPTLTGNHTLVAAFSCLLLVAAIARSSQVPLQRWLPATLAAPTPVSALLHAGVINAGGVLLVRMSPLFGTSTLASTLAFFAGAATVIYGTVLMLAKPDIKGALAHSTMGQMGFMIMTCGLGAFAAAIFHLVAHGMYKATLFLGSGTAVHRYVRHRKAPPKNSTPDAAIVRISIFAPAWAAFAVLSAATVVHPHVGGRTGSGALLIFAWATAASATWGLLRRRPPTPALAAGLLGILAGAWAYIGWLKVVTSFLAVDLPSLGQAPATPWLLAVVLPALALIEFVRTAGMTDRVELGARIGALHDTVYVFALSAGHVITRAARSQRPHASQAPAGRWASLETSSEAVRP